MARRSWMRAGGVLTAALLAAAAAAGDAQVKDGDSLKLGARDIRLFGIDAPESRQMCARADGTPWPCGQVAAARLAELARQGPVRCRPMDNDRYGRLVSICTAGGVDLGGRLVAEGLARAYTRFSDAYVELEAEARAAGLGLWQGAAEAPWAYRAETAPPAAGGFVPAAGGPPSPECAVKGNISASGARIYHLPGGPGYSSTRVDTDRGEAWFCDEDAARAAGFRPPRGAR
jgi:endonuclease YncB( thermonuclease family)